MPKCIRSKDREYVYLPSLEMCRVASEKCRVLFDTDFLPPNLRCDSKNFPCKNCQNDVRQMKFNAIGQCMSPLIPTDSSINHYPGLSIFWLKKKKRNFCVKFGDLIWSQNYRSIQILRVVAFSAKIPCIQMTNMIQCMRLSFGERSSVLHPIYLWLPHFWFTIGNIQSIQHGIYSTLAFVSFAIGLGKWSQTNNDVRAEIDFVNSRFYSHLKLDASIPPWPSRGHCMPPRWNTTLFGTKWKWKSRLYRAIYPDLLLFNSVKCLVCHIYLRLVSTN